MNPLSDVFIPKNYDDYLSELRHRHFAWKMDFSSKTNVSNTGQITYYEIRDAAARGNFVLVPGLASNTQIEPLMRAVTYWSLKHKYNIYAVDHFLGDFQPSISVESARKNTVPEFIDLMDVGFDIVSKMSANKWTCVIGHSIGGIGITEVFNRRVQQNKPIGFSGAILFAPFVTKEWGVFTRNFMKHYQYPKLSDEEFYKNPIGMTSYHDICEHKRTRYVSLFPEFLDEIVKLKPQPELIARYNIPVTLVAGGKDKKSPAGHMRAICSDVQKISNNGNMKIVEFPTGRHSFIDQHNDWAAILRLIKSQRPRVKQK